MEFLVPRLFPKFVQGALRWFTNFGNGALVVKSETLAEVNVERAAFASPERFPDVPLIAEWPDVALPPLNIDHYTAFVALTHDPKIDDPALLHAFERGCFYIGALGSRKTHAKRGERLKAQGAKDADIARIHAPIGLSIGAVSPSEIAVAIMAEITAQLRLPKEAKEAAA